MLNKITLVIATIALIIGIIGIATNGNVSLSGATHFSGPIDATEGFSVDDTVVVDGSGNWDGAVTGSTGSFSGLLTASDDAEVTGDFAVATTTNVYPFVVNNATSTFMSNGAGTSTALYIFSSASGMGGRIILEDTDGAGCSEIAILNGTVLGWTISCPAGFPQ